jgi:hypothetical protein
VFDYQDPELMSKIRQSSHGTLKHIVDAVASGEAPQRVADTFEVGDGENQGYVAAVSEGIKYMMDGKVSGEKLTYRIVDTPKN